MSFCLSLFRIFGVFFSVLVFALCCLPCSVAGGVVHMQKIENSLVFVGRKPYAPCSGNARSNQLSGGTRNKYRWKKELKKRTHGTRKQGQEKSIFEAQMAPKMDPGGFQKRAQDGRQLKRPKTPLGAPQERHQTILERFSSHTGIRGLSKDYTAHLISPTWAPGSAQLSKKST